MYLKNNGARPSRHTRISRPGMHLSARNSVLRAFIIHFRYIILYNRDVDFQIKEKDLAHDFHSCFATANRNNVSDRHPSYVETNKRRKTGKTRQFLLCLLSK